MPRLLDRLSGDIDDPVIIAHADPDERPDGYLDGLIVDGHDPFAARRQQIREQHDGRPDPIPVPDAPHRGRPLGSVALNTRPLAQIDRTPAAAPRAQQTQTPRIVPLSVEDYERLPQRGAGVRNEMAVLGADLLETEECIRVTTPIDPKAGKVLVASLRKECKNRGWTVQVRSGRGFFAVRRLSTTPVEA